ncbi:ABC transporter substrate-binding protein [Chelativorans xinjiangense]|uniref:ABC transporter substrate-binding protein n=1 Tax=Chelativorans xinjiangense TaxID=2681485 RepID=UPI001FECB382|nr:extracellular solute-binding protein [Chelativorans xinjiangense]
MSIRRIDGLSRRAFLASSSAFALAALAGRSLAQEVKNIDPSLAEKIPIADPSLDLPPADGPFRWLDSGGQKGVFYRQFFPKYAEARGIEVVYDGLPWNEIATVLPLGIRNGSAPDAFNLPNGMPPAVAVAEGWVQPLDELIPDFEAWKAGFPAGSFVEGVNVIEGKTYGLPYTSERRCSSLLLFNRKAMELTEFDPGPDSPLTWDQFRKAAAQITENSGGSMFGLIMGGNQGNRWSANLVQLANRAGAACASSVAGCLTGVDYRTGEIVIDSDEFVQAMELLLAIRDDGSMFPGIMSLNAPQARAFVEQGGAGMILQGPWNVPIWEANNPDFDFGFTATPAPEGKDGKTIVDALPSAANTMYVNAAAKNPAYAADVFHYMGTLEGQVAWGNVVGPSDPPIFPKAAEEAEMSERSKAVIALQEKQVRVSPVVYARSPGFTKVAQLYEEPTPNLANVVQGLYTGQLSGVKENLSKLKGAMNAALDKAIADANAEGANVRREDLVYSDWDPSVDYAS